MRITITATDKITTLDGIPCRIWEGVTDRGIQCHVFVHRLAVLNEGDRCDEFDRELKETYPPSAEIIPLAVALLLGGDDPLDAA